MKGTRICCLGRLNDAKIIKTECKKYGETFIYIFSNQIDYVKTQASILYGILGFKVWVSYFNHEKGDKLCYIQNVQDFINIKKTDLKVVKQTIHNFVSENMACKVVKLLVIFLISSNQYLALFDDSCFHDSPYMDSKK